MVWGIMDGAFRDPASPKEKRRQVNTKQVLLEFVPQDIRLQIHLTQPLSLGSRLQFRFLAHNAVKDTTPYSLPSMDGCKNTLD
jgi:hypothetical protein